MARGLILLLLIIMIVSLPVQAHSEGVRVVVDGEELSLDSPPIIEDGRVLVPVRSLFATIGAEIVWDEETKTVVGIGDDFELIVPVGSIEIVVNGEPIVIDLPAKVVAGRVYLPIRFVGEALGGEVKWDTETRTIMVTLAGDMNGDIAVFFPQEEGGTEEQPLSKKISINSADQKKLQTVTGVDEKTAAGIVEYREINGPFWQIEDIKKVPGVDDDVFNAMRDEITVAYEERGMASWYGSEFQGRRTASGELFKQEELTAAHPELPFGTYVNVKFPSTGKDALVRINDRGPHVPGRIIDLSRGAADAIGLRPYGVAEVVVNVMGKQTD